MTHPQAGDFGLRKGGGPAMAAVRWATGVPRWSWGKFWRIPAKYGHAALVVNYDAEASPSAPVQIIEAAPGGVRMQWVREDFFDWSTGGRLENQLGSPASEVRTIICRGAWDVLKSDYDWPSILEFAPRFFYAEFTGRFASKPDEKLFCSEMVVWLYRKAGVSFGPEIPDRVASGAVSPQQLAPFLPTERK
jgi:hypothetical protein